MHTTYLGHQEHKKLCFAKNVETLIKNNKIVENYDILVMVLEFLIKVVNYLIKIEKYSIKMIKF